MSGTFIVGVLCGIVLTIMLEVLALVGFWAWLLLSGKGIIPR